MGEILTGEQIKIIITKANHFVYKNTKNTCKPIFHIKIQEYNTRNKGNRSKEYTENTKQLATKVK